MKVIKEGIIDGLNGNAILIAKSNTEISIEESVSPRSFDGNNVVGTAEILREFATLHRLEQSVSLYHHDSEHFFASIVESSNDAIVSKSLQGIIQTWNSGAQRLFGYSAEQAIGSHISLIIPEERVHEEEHILGRICGGERVEHYETVRRRIDGELVQVSITVSPIRNEKGEIIGASKIARDISERLHTELALQQNEERYRALTEASATVVWRTSPKGEVLFASDDWSRITGQSEEEKTGWGWLNAIHPEDQNRTIQCWKESIANQTLHENEFRVRTRDGSYRWFVVRSVPVFNTDGSVREWVGANTDIHDRRTAEEELIASSLRFQTLADNIAQFAWMADATGSIYWYNQRWYDFTGTTLHEMKGWGWKKVHHPDYVDGVVKNFQRSLDSGQKWEDTFPIRGKDGQYRWFLSHALPIRENGKIVSWFGTNTDITQQRDAEKSLRESEQRMRLATEATGVGIWEWNILTGEVRWDSQMFRIYGISVPESRGVTYSDWSNAVVPEDLKRQEEALQNTIKTVGSNCREFRIRRKVDQKLRHVQSFETVRTNADGRPEWVVGTNLDITDRKIAEDALRRLAADLSDMDRRKDEFLATLAHELRNPLAPIRSGLQLLQMSDINCEEAKETRGIMERQLTQLVRLVDDLMDVSRIVTGKIELQRKPILLSEVLNSAIETSRSLIEQMNHRLTIRMPETPIRLDADFTRLAQVFLNLVNNAAKYSEPNGSISIDVRLSGNDAIVSIRDTGIGMSKEQLPLIFEMFTQVDRSLEKSRGGLGIGLSLVRRLLDMHGGSIVVTSAGVGMGSEFVVRIPTQSPQATAAIDSPSEKELTANRSLRILIVDDNRDSVTTMSMLLRRLGHQTYQAFDGEEALEATREFKPQVVLLDIGLPKLNGYEVCRWIRAQEQIGKVVVIAQTGWGQEETRQKTSDAGFDYHLVKPLDPKALRKILAKLAT
jgi:PAS domain S-box-containing protein